MEYKDTQKTYKGRSAGSWIRRAHLARMRSGNVEVVTGELPGCTFNITDDGGMAISGFDGTVAVLEMSATARDRLEYLMYIRDRQQ